MQDTTLAGTYVEIIGKVSDSGEELREYTCINFGDSLGEWATALVRFPSCSRERVTMSSDGWRTF